MGNGMPGARQKTSQLQKRTILLLDWGETGTTFFVLLRIIMDTLPCLLYRERNCTPVKVTVAYITRGASTRSRCHRRDAQSRLLERILKERVRICNTIRRSQGRVQYWVNESFPFKRSSTKPRMIFVFYTRLLLDGLC